MADAIAAKREARRRRILDNSENRLHKITGKFLENSAKEKLNNDTNQSRLQTENGFSKNATSAAQKAVLKEQRNHLKEDNSFDFQEFEFSKPSVQHWPADNHLSFNHPIQQRTLKGDGNIYDNLNSNPIPTSPSQLSQQQYQYSILHSLFFSSLSNVILAAFLNILLIANFDLSLYKGIIPPYIVMAITRLCLGNKSEESPDSSMLAAALILYNINPEIVHKFQKILTICSTASKDLALYLTSFALFHWFITICWTDSSYIKFF